MNNEFNKLELWRILGSILCESLCVDEIQDTYEFSGQITIDGRIASLLGPCFEKVIEESDSDICKHACYLTVGDSELKDWYRCHNPKSHMFNKSIMKVVCDDCPLKFIAGDDK